MVERARGLFFKGEPDAALAALESLPTDAETLALRAAIRLYKGDRAGSRQDADRAVELDPRSTEARLVRARLLETEGLRPAIAEASAVLEIDPRHAAAAYWRGVWKAVTGDEAGAREDLARSSEAPPNDVRTCQYRGLARMALGDFDGAVKDFDRAAELGMNLPGLFYARAQAKSGLKDRRGAIDDFGRAMERGPATAHLHLERGRERFLDGDRTGAIADVEQAIRLDPNSTASYYFRGKARPSSERLEAQRDFVRACATDPTDADGFLYRGLAKEEAERFAEAVPDFERALELAPFFHPRRPEIEAKVKAGPKRRRRSILDREYRPWLSLVVAAASIAVWLAQGEWGSTPDMLTLRDRGGVSRYSVRCGDYWRLFTAMFLHVGWLHLAWNLYGGVSWCVAVERTIGPWRYLAAYLLSGIGGCTMSVLGHSAVSAGASGALFGMIGTALAIYYVNLRTWMSFFGHPEVRRILTSILIWTALGLTVLRGMDNFAHFGGFLFGALFGWLYVGAPQLETPKRILAWTLVVALLAGAVVGACVPSPSPFPKSWPPVERAQAALQKGRIEEAFKEATEAIRQAPEAPDAYIVRGQVYLIVHRRAAAIADFRQALERTGASDSDRKSLKGLIDQLERLDQER
jgi:membrane associated rhomboid family serine protease/Tfp pilus assembly protein PilF